MCARQRCSFTLAPLAPALVMYAGARTRATFAKESPNYVTKNYGFLYSFMLSLRAASEHARGEFRMGFVYPASPPTTTQWLIVGQRVGRCADLYKSRDDDDDDDDSEVHKGSLSTLPALAFMTSPKQWTHCPTGVRMHANAAVAVPLSARP